MYETNKSIGLLCSNCDGKCPICDSFVKPTEQVRICQDCSQGHLSNKCILCANNLGENNENGVLAYYCLECVRLEKHREGCPRIINVGGTKTDMIYMKRKIINQVYKDFKMNKLIKSLNIYIYMYLYLPICIISG